MSNGTHNVIKEDNVLSPAAANLSRRAPQEWAQFKVAFKLYVDAQLRLMLKAPKEELHRLQGKAQECEELAALFDDAVIAADRIHERAGKQKSKN